MTVYYCSDATGDDADDGLSEANAFLTIDKAMNTVAAGDKVWVKADGTYSEDALVDTVGTVNAFVVFEGYTTTIGDDGQATMAATTSCIAVGTATTTSDWYYFFKNMKFTGGSAAAWSGGAGVDSCFFDNCEFSGSSTYGAQGDNKFVFYNCIFFNNTSGGTFFDSSVAFIHCIGHGNGVDGAFRASAPVCIGCLAYNNTTSNTRNFYYDNVASNHIMYGCTVDGENTSGSRGMDQNSSTSGFMIAVNNILYDCAHGIKRTTDVTDRAIIGFNLVNSNTTNYTLCENTQGGDQTSAPSFTDEANDDYTLGSSSPAIDAGVDLNNV